MGTCVELIAMMDMVWLGICVPDKVTWGEVGVKGEESVFDMLEVAMVIVDWKFVEKEWWAGPGI